MGYTLTMSTEGGGGTSEPSYADSQLTRLIIGSERYRELDRRQSYYDCTQHDRKRFDFDGRVISPGGHRAANPMISAEKMPGIVPMGIRRPSAPYRLGKAIIDAYTNIVFGEDRFPEIRVAGDVDAQDWNQELSKAADLPSRMILARNWGGACGSVGLSWAIVDGDPVVRVHNTKSCRVVAWKNQDNFVPLVVEEVRLFYRDEPDPENGNRVMRIYYWWRRTWNPDQDIVYKEIRARSGEAPVWEIDVDKTDNHGDGECRFTWIQNRPGETEDGTSDLEGVWEQCDQLDIIYSVLAKGGIRNLDPTLILSMDAGQIKVMGMRKGSDNAIITGKDGDAKYLEIAGTSVTAGLALFESLRKSTLETAQCVVPDPADIAAQGVSSVAIKVIYSPMLANAALLRTAYGRGMRRVLDGLSNYSRKVVGQPIVIQNPDGTSSQGQLTINLPPRAVEEPDVDEMGMPTSAMSTKLVPRSPGVAGQSDLNWPPWFPPTPDDQSKLSTTLTAATGGKAYVSAQTAAEVFARSLGVDPQDEWERIQNQSSAEQDQQAQMFQDAGGPVDPNVDPNDPNAQQPPDPNADPNDPAADPGNTPPRPPGPPRPPFPPKPKLPPPAAAPPPRPGAGRPPFGGKPNPFAKR